MKITTPDIAPNIAPDTPKIKTKFKKNITPLISVVSASNLISVPDQIVTLDIFPYRPSICHFIPVFYNGTIRIYLIFNRQKERVKFPINSHLDQIIGAVTPTSNEPLIVQTKREQIVLRYLLGIKEHDKIRWSVDTIGKKQYIYITKYKD